MVLSDNKLFLQKFLHILKTFYASKYYKNILLFSFIFKNIVDNLFIILTYCMLLKQDINDIHVKLCVKIFSTGIYIYIYIYKSPMAVILTCKTKQFKASIYTLDIKIKYLVSCVKFFNHSRNFRYSIHIIEITPF